MGGEGGEEEEEERKKIFAPRNCPKLNVKIFSSCRNKHSALNPYRIKVIEQLFFSILGCKKPNSRWFQKTVAMDFSIQNYVSSRYGLVYTK